MVATWKCFKSPFWKISAWYGPTLTEYVRNTVSLLYKQQKGWNSGIWNFLAKKIILAYISLKIDIFRSVMLYYVITGAFVDPGGMEEIYPPKVEQIWPILLFSACFWQCSAIIPPLLTQDLPYRVIVTSYVDRFSWFWYQWKEETFSYTMIPNNYTLGVSISNSQGSGNHPS